MGTIIIYTILFWDEIISFFIIFLDFIRKWFECWKWEEIKGYFNSYSLISNMEKKKFLIWRRNRYSDAILSFFINKTTVISVVIAVDTIVCHFNLLNKGQTAIAMKRMKKGNNESSNVSLFHISNLLLHNDYVSFQSFFFLLLFLQLCLPYYMLYAPFILKRTMINFMLPFLCM